MSLPIYCVGDIHGQLDMLQGAIMRIERDGGRDAEIVFLGDLVDRGPNSKGVIDLLMNGQAQGRNWRVLKGNHDRFFTLFYDTGTLQDGVLRSDLNWMHPRMGGLDTMASYGVNSTFENPNWEDAKRKIPAEHAEFMRNLPLYHLHNDLLFVHAGIKPNVPLDQQVENDLIWIRGPFHDHTDPHPWLVVHGHTALDEPQHFGNRIDLDSGAGYGRPITAAVFEGRDCYVLTDTGHGIRRDALTP